MCTNCESLEEELDCDLSIDDLYRYSYDQIMGLVKEQEILNKPGVIMH